MDFLSVINIFGLLFNIILIVPHIVYAKTHTYDMTIFDNRAMLYIDRIGRYCSVFLMFVNIGLLEGGFTSDYMKKYWIVSSIILSVIYVLLWLVFFKTEKRSVAYAIIIISTLIIIQSGILQVKTLLFTFGIVYLIGELYMASKFFRK